MADEATDAKTAGEAEGGQQETQVQQQDDSQQDAIASDISADVNLFGETVYTKEQLSGAEGPPEGAATDEGGNKGEVSQPSGERKTETSPPSDGKKPGDDSQTPSSETKKEDEQHQKPPEGYVPSQALREERLKRQSEQRQREILLSENKRLISEIEQLRQQGQPATQRPGNETITEEKDEFKVLTDEEFDSLLEEDNAAATRYLRALSKHKDQENQRERERGQQEQQKQGMMTIIQNAMEQIEKAIPGIYDEENDINTRLIDYAETHGMDVDYLMMLTNPATKIVTPDGKATYLMGRGAATLMQMLHSAYQDRQNIEKTLREAVTNEVTAELMKKFKDTGGGGGLGDLSRTGSEEISGGALTEADFARMTPEQVRKALGG